MSVDGMPKAQRIGVLGWKARPARKSETTKDTTKSNVSLIVDGVSPFEEQNPFATKTAPTPRTIVVSNGKNIYHHDSFVLLLVDHHGVITSNKTTTTPIHLTRPPAAFSFSLGRPSPPVSSLLMRRLASASPPPTAAAGSVALLFCWGVLLALVVFGSASSFVLLPAAYHAPSSPTTEKSRSRRCSSSTTTSSRGRRDTHASTVRRGLPHPPFLGTTLAFSSSSQEQEPSAALATTIMTTSQPSSNVEQPFHRDYNVPLEIAALEWTVALVAPDDFWEGGMQLRARTPKNYTVDAFQVTVTRSVESPGLGIELLELAGRDQDGVGITVVSGIVEGGNACHTPLLPGDVISQVQVLGVGGADNQQTEVLARVGTECLNYDQTVEAIASLPRPTSNDDKPQTVVLTVKRLRRRPKVQVTFHYPPSQREPSQTLELLAGENLRRAMLVRGIKLNDPLARRFDSGGTGDCGAEGTCATCSVSVVRGQHLLNPPGLTEAQILKPNPRWRMACRTIVGHDNQEGELVVRVNPRQWDE